MGLGAWVKNKASAVASAVGGAAASAYEAIAGPDDSKWLIKAGEFEHNKRDKEPAKFMPLPDAPDEHVVVSSRLGQGQYGATHLMQLRDGNWTIRAAVKLIKVDDAKSRPPFPLDNERAKEALDERDLMMQLNKLECEYIVKLIDSFYMNISDGAYGRCVCLALEPLEMTLLDAIERFNGLEIMAPDSSEEARKQAIAKWHGLAAQWLHQAGQGLLALHDGTQLSVTGADGVETEIFATWLHRDLKPSNIMLSDNPFANDEAKPVAKLIDFGLSYQKEENGRSRVSAKVGTDAYASPEKFSKQQYDERDDVWAFGCLIFDCITRRPFELAATTKDPARGETGVNLQDDERYRDHLIKEVEKSAPQHAKALAGCWEQTPDKRSDMSAVVNAMENAFFIEDGVPKLRPPPRVQEDVVQVASEIPQSEQAVEPPAIVPQPSMDEPRRVRVTLPTDRPTLEPRVSRQISGRRVPSFKTPLTSVLPLSRPGTPATEKIKPLSATHAAAADGNGPPSPGHECSLACLSLEFIRLHAMSLLLSLSTAPTDAAASLDCTRSSRASAATHG